MEKVQDVKANPSVFVLRVCSGSASDPISKFLYQLRAPLRVLKRSSCIQVVEELRSLLPRIRSTHRLNASLGGRGYSLPMPVETIPYLDVLDACKRDIEELSTGNRRLTTLDLDMAAAAWAKGLQFALHRNRETKPSSLSS